MTSIQPSGGNESDEAQIVSSSGALKKRVSMSHLKCTDHTSNHDRDSYVPGSHPVDITAERRCRRCCGL